MSPELYVTNFNRNFTGVSATAAAVLRNQIEQFDARLVGYPLPGCPQPISKSEAFALSKTPPSNKPFAIWHVRRNPEMRAAIWARDVLKRPIKIVFTSAAQRLHSAYPRWLISRMDVVIATTDKASEFVPHVRAVIPHGVDTNLFQPAGNKPALWKALGFQGTKGIVTVGRIRPEKGTDRFVKAMLDYLPTDKDAHAVLMGKASREFKSFQKELEDQIATAGLSDRISFVGETDPSRTAQIMQAASLLVALPRYEGFGVTPLEALASGIPFIGTDVGAFRDFTNGGQFGETISAEEDDCSKVIKKWMSKSTERFAKASAKFVTDHWSAQKEAHSISKVYEEVLS